MLQRHLATAALIAALATMVSASQGPAQAQVQAAPGQPAGHEILAAKCFQCHTDSMWRDQRQSTRAWEATLYRMIGRGALWEPDEVRRMADYLGTDFGPNAAKPTAPAQK